jgi:hypothetical protein
MPGNSRKQMGMQAFVRHFLSSFHRHATLWGKSPSHQEEEEAQNTLQLTSSPRHHFRMGYPAPETWAYSSMYGLSNYPSVYISLLYEFTILNMSF